MATQPLYHPTEEEYLERERAASERSEYVDGEVFEMPGTSLRHSRLTINWTLVLGTKLAGTGFNLFSSDTRIAVRSTGSYVYADLCIVEGKPESHEKDNLLNPTLIIEVLSPSTEDYDHGKKFALYREIPTFADYLLVHTSSAFVEHFSRQSEASWLLREQRGPEAEFLLPSVHCSVKLADIYQGVFDIPE